MNAIILFKFYLATLFLLMLFSLGSGLFFIVKDDPKSNRLVTSLTFRISISIILFISLFIGFKFGWIQPHSLGQY